MIVIIILIILFAVCIKTADKVSKSDCDPIEKMEKDWDKGDLDLEDIFWIDEILGDDD